jgi:hypothetical protein
VRLLTRFELQPNLKKQQVGCEPLLVASLQKNKRQKNPPNIQYVLYSTVRAALDDRQSINTHVPVAPKVNNQSGPFIIRLKIEQRR